MRGISFDGVYDCQFRRTIESFTRSVEKNKEKVCMGQSGTETAGFFISNNCLEFGDVWRKF